MQTFAFDYDREVDKIVARYLKDIKKNYGIYVCGTGGGSLGEVNLVGLHLECYQRLSVLQARLLFLDCVEDLLKRINSNRTLRPNLQNYPFDTKNLDFMLAFQDKNGRKFPEDSVALVFIANETIFYNTFDLNGKQYKKIYDEPYSEALKTFQDYKTKNALLSNAIY